MINFCVCLTISDVIIEKVKHIFESPCHLKYIKAKKTTGHGSVVLREIISMTQHFL